VAITWFTVMLNMLHFVKIAQWNVCSYIFRYKIIYSCKMSKNKHHLCSLVVLTELYGTFQESPIIYQCCNIIVVDHSDLLKWHFLMFLIA
jgi:hypothetical protein